MSDPSVPGTRYQALIQLLRTAEELWNSSRVFFARWDLSPSQFNVLNLLFSQPNGLSQSDLSRLLIMHRSNATGLVDRLERRGLLRREDVPEDRRTYRVLLTPEGRGLLAEIYPHYYAAAHQVWADTPDTRVQALLTELQQLTRNAEAVAAHGEAPQQPEIPMSPPALVQGVPRSQRPSISRADRAASLGTAEVPDPTEASLRTSDL